MSKMANTRDFVRVSYVRTKNISICFALEETPRPTSSSTHLPKTTWDVPFNPLDAELNPICHLLALLGGATIVVVSRLRVKETRKYTQYIRSISEGSPH